MKAALALEAKFGREHGVRLLSRCSFVRNLLNANFMKAALALEAKFGREDGVRLLSTDSFAKKLLNANFLKAALELEAKFGREDGVRLLSTDSFAKNLLNANFLKAALELEAKFGREDGVLSSTGSFVTNLLNANYMKAALALEAKFGREHGVRLLSRDSFAKNLLNAKFLKAALELEGQVWARGRRPSRLQKQEAKFRVRRPHLTCPTSSLRYSACTTHATNNGIPAKHIFKMLGEGSAFLQSSLRLLKSSCAIHDAATLAATVAALTVPYAKRGAAVSSFLL